MQKGVGEREAVIGEVPIREAPFVMAAVERLGGHVVQGDVAIHMHVVVGVINAEHGVLHAQALEQEAPHVGPDHIVRCPRTQVADDEGMLAVAAHRAGFLVAEAEVEESFAVGFVVLKAEERDRADVALGDLPIWGA